MRKKLLLKPCATLFLRALLLRWLRQWRRGAHVQQLRQRVFGGGRVPAAAGGQVLHAHEGGVALRRHALEQAHQLVRALVRVRVRVTVTVTVTVS